VSGAAAIAPVVLTGRARCTIIPRPSMALLPRESISELHEAALQAGLERNTLLSGLEVHLRANLPVRDTLGAQLLSDLEALRHAERGDDGTIPLAIWLRNATLLAGSRAERATFQRCLAALDDPAAPSPPAKPSRLDRILGVAREATTRRKLEGALAAALVSIVPGGLISTFSVWTTYERRVARNAASLARGSEASHKVTLVGWDHAGRTRGDLARLIRKLAAARTAVIAVNMAPVEKPGDPETAQLAESITAARQGGTAVVFGVGKIEGGKPRLDLTVQEALTRTIVSSPAHPVKRAASSGWGFACVDHDDSEPWSSILMIQSAADPGRLVPFFPLTVALAFESDREPARITRASVEDPAEDLFVGPGLRGRPLEIALTNGSSTRWVGFSYSGGAFDGCPMIGAGDRAAHRILSFSDEIPAPLELDDILADKVSAEHFEEKVVLVGSESTRIPWHGLTAPRSILESEGEAIDALLRRGEALHPNQAGTASRANIATYYLSALLLGVATAACHRGLAGARAAARWGGVALIVGAYLALSFYAAVRHGLLFNVHLPVAVALLAPWVLDRLHDLRGRSLRASRDGSTP
jgi:hypothetical protein